MTNEAILKQVTGMTADYIASLQIDGHHALTAMTLARADERDNKWISVEDLEGVITAWEALKGNRNYSPKEIEKWLSKDMKPMIDKIRIKIKRTHTT